MKIVTRNHDRATDLATVRIGTPDSESQPVVLATVRDGVQVFLKLSSLGDAGDYLRAHGGLDHTTL